MSPRDATLRLRDMLEAIERIRAFTRDLTFDRFRDDEMTVSAVLYQFVVLGEAARGVPAEVVLRHPKVEWAQARAFRNVMAHVYFGVKLDIVWDTIHNNLPTLEAALRQALAEETGTKS